MVRRLRKLMPPPGEARDRDVFCEWLADIPVSRQLLSRARARRAAARRRAREAAASPKFQIFLLRTLRWLHSAPLPQSKESLSEFAGKALERLHRKALKRARGIDWRDAGTRHVLRIRVKRLRYACEFFASCFPRTSARPYLRRLEVLQDILGELNDVAVGRRLLAELDGSALVRAKLKERETHLIRALEPAWGAFEKSRAFWTPRE